MTKEIPFNLERALAGDPVITRDGSPVTQITNFSINNDKNLMGVVNQQIWAWCKNGKYWSDGEPSWCDLFMAPPPKKRMRGFLNVYPSNLYCSHKEADLDALDTRILCIEIDAEEGEGLGGEHG